MKRQIIRVEPLSTYLERWKAPTSAVTRSPRPNRAAASAVVNGVRVRA